MCALVCLSVVVAYIRRTALCGGIDLPKGPPIIKLRFAVCADITLKETQSAYSTLRAIDHSSVYHRPIVRCGNT